MEKLKINTHGNENYSKAVQDLLFKLGYRWLGWSTDYDTSKIWLFTWPDKTIGQHKECVSPEKRTVTFEDLVEMVEKKEKAERVPEYTMQELIGHVGHNFKITK
jgi:hypothetical protein